MYGLIGYPLGHSFSPGFFKAKFEREGIDDSYELFPLEKIEEVKRLVASKAELNGFNVTIPYKETILPFLTARTAAAKEIGAVNTVSVERDEQGRAIGLTGDNTDWIGFRDSLKPLLKPEMRKALVLGTGGASKAVVYALRQLGIEPTLVSRNRNPERGIIAYEDITPQMMAENLVIVNTTPLGMTPNIETLPDIRYDCLTEGHLCYDLVYNPETTLFLQRSAEQGAAIKSGLEMLHLQAEAAWRIWNGNC